MQIHEITLKPLKEGVLGGIAKGLTNMAFDYGARTTGVNLRPYFTTKDDKGTVTIKDAKGVNHTYTKSGEKWYDKTGKEVDPATSAVLDSEAQKQARSRATATSTPAATPAVTATTTPTPAATTAAQSAPAATTTPTATPAAAPVPVAKTRTGGRIAGQLSQTPNAVRKRAARAAKKVAPATAGTNAFGQMAQQLTPTRTASSTGGTITQTPTGLMHRAKPTPAVAAAAPVAKKKTVAKKKPAAAKPLKFTGRKKISPATGAPTPDEYANLERRLQQALAAQGQRA